MSTDISASRARALLKNLELAGITNCCVTAEEPGKLAETFGAYFDKILVDAPCSGEGMFRKEPELVKSWLERGPMAYVSLQREILKQAARMLKPGGEMVYSTCTFSPEEDEGAVDWLLEQMPELELAAIAPWEGAASGINGKPVIRLFPHRVRGEGHFIALLRRRKDAIKDRFIICRLILTLAGGFGICGPGFCWEVLAGGGLSPHRQWQWRLSRESMQEPFP